MAEECKELECPANTDGLPCCVGTADKPIADMLAETKAVHKAGRQPGDDYGIARISNFRIDWLIAEVERLEKIEKLRAKIVKDTNTAYTLLSQAHGYLCERPHNMTPELSLILGAMSLLTAARSEAPPELLMS